MTVYISKGVVTTSYRDRDEGRRIEGERNRGRKGST